jgi:aspartate carbamoyltransferase catalytic subunit
MGTFAPRHFVSIDDITPDEMRYLMDRSRYFDWALREKRTAEYRLIPANIDETIALEFFEASLRTHQSFLVAAQMLGGHIIGFDDATTTSYGKKGESLAHTAQMLAGYGASVIVVRHRLDGTARFLSEAITGAKIINAGDGTHEHPTQAILDRYGILKTQNRLERGHPNSFSLRGLRIAMVGDLRFGRVPHSDVKNFADDGVHFIFIAPDNMAMPKAYLKFLENRGSTYEIYPHLDADILRQTDILMMFRPQRERMDEQTLATYLRVKRNFQLTAELARELPPNLKIFHPLPIPKFDPEIDPAVERLPQCYYFEQAKGGIPTRMVLLGLATGYLRQTEFEGKPYILPVHDAQFWSERPPIVRHVDDSDYFLKPLRNNGTVIDHLPPYTDQTIISMLRLPEREAIYRGGTIRKHGQSGIKGIVIIEDLELTDDERRQVAAFTASRILPGAKSVTENLIRGGVVQRKRDLSPPQIFAGVGHCRNQLVNESGQTVSGCISLPEFYEHVEPRFLLASPGQYRCYWCGHLMDSHEIFEK